MKEGYYIESDITKIKNKYYLFVEEEKFKKHLKSI